MIKHGKIRSDNIHRLARIKRGWDIKQASTFFGVKEYKLRDWERGVGTVPKETEDKIVLEYCEDVKDILSMGDLEKKELSVKCKAGRPTSDKVKDMIELKKTMTYQQIAEKYGISKQAVFISIKLYSERFLND